MEILKPIDGFLVNEGFAGFEDDRAVSCGIMGCEKGFKPFADIVDGYHKRHFVVDGQLDTTTIVKTVTGYFEPYGQFPTDRNRQ